MPNFDAFPPPYAPRRFTPFDANLVDPDTVRALYQTLINRRIGSEAELEAWAEDESELASAIDEQRSRLYVNMTCHTDNAAHAEAYRRFVDTVPAAMKPLQHAFHEKYLSLRTQYPRTSPRFEVYDRGLEAERAVFRESNVALQTRDELLAQDYQTLMGAQLTAFEGKEYTPQQMMRFQQDPDRGLREAAWRALSQRRLQDKEAIHRIFEDQVRVRHQQAVNAGFPDYVDFAFAVKQRFDYTRDDCKAFHRGVERHFTPLRRDRLAHRREMLKVDRLRPWDLMVDPEGKAPLKPFADCAELIDQSKRMFSDLDGELAELFEALCDNGLLDLDNRMGKAPGGYQLTFEEVRLPFIFMNAVGMDNDVRILLHEAGHAFHAQLSAHQPLLAYRNPPIEFCEVASFAMELLGGDLAHHIYVDPEDQARSQRDFFESKVSLLPWVATVDAFQHWIYEQHAFEADAAANQWVATMNRFSGGIVDWSGLEEEQAHLWHAQVHFFTSPMYYIEYGIAQLGALHLWLIARENRARALQLYKTALTIGGSRPLPALFEAAGLAFDMTEDALAAPAHALARALSAL